MINNLMKLTPYFKKIFNYCNFEKIHFAIILKI